MTASHAPQVLFSFHLAAFSSLPHIYPALKISMKEAFAMSGWRPGLFLSCLELALRVFKWVYYGIIII